MDWMSRLNDNVLLKDLNIPGAHNSGQVDFRVYGNKEGTNWAEAQRHAKQVASIYEMLNAGVRALDKMVKGAKLTDPNTNEEGTVTSDKPFLMGGEYCVNVDFPSDSGAYSCEYFIY